ncbi:MAG: hypothetical protein ACK5OA_04610 [Acidovorax sp.]
MQEKPSASKPRSELYVRALAWGKATLRATFARLEHEEIKGEFDGLALLDDQSFAKAKVQHFARRQMPARSDNLGVTLLLAIIGAPGSLIAGMFTDDVAYYFGAAFWSIVAVALYTYMVRAAKYWRQHNAIRSEEVRRFGQASFG